MLEETLVSVLQHRPRECEIVVVPDQFYADPYDLTDELMYVQARQGAGLAEAVNLGIAASRAPIIHVLAAGTHVDEGWTEPAVEHFDDPRVAAVAPLVLDANDPGKVVAAGAAYRPSGSVKWLARGSSARRIERRRRRLEARLTGPHFSAALFRRSAWELLGRFSEKVSDRLAWLDFSLSAEQAGLVTVLEPRSQVRTALAGAGRSGPFRQALDAERFFWRWAARAWGQSLAMHTLAVPAACLGELPRPAALAHAAGRLVGLLAAGSHRAHFERLQRCRALVEATVPGPEEPHESARRPLAA